MNIFKKLFGKKKKSEEKKQVEEKKSECWYNNAHEGSLGHSENMPCDANGGNSLLDFATTKNIAQN